jgi:CRISPR/Cas system-associated exonuclease Cas4 (RecB family)
VDPRAGLDTEDRGKILCPCRGWNPDCPVVQPVVKTLYCLSYPAPKSMDRLIYLPKFPNFKSNIDKNILRTNQIHLGWTLNKDAYRKEKKRQRLNA